MTWLGENWRWVGVLLREHLLIALPAIAAAILVSIPIGRFAYRFPKVGGIILSAATLTYAVPSLPLLVAVPLIIGTPLRSPLTIIVALGLYGMALLVRTASDAFASVDRAVIEGAKAVGHSRRTLFWTVELPLAIPVLVSGIRVIAVSTVGLVTIGALVGIPSVGTLLTDGFQRGITIEVLTGIIVTVALALTVDAIVVFVGKLLTPWLRTGQGRREKVGQGRWAKADERRQAKADKRRQAGADKGRRPGANTGANRDRRVKGERV